MELFFMFLAVWGASNYNYAEVTMSHAILEV
jgi:hypothetical protein